MDKMRNNAQWSDGKLPCNSNLGSDLSYFGRYTDT